MELVFLILGIVILIIALSYFALRKKDGQKPQTQKAKRGAVNCPMCGSPLLNGQNMFSKVFRPMNVPDQRCIITGCPNCYPLCQPGIKRVCPVCKKTVPQDGHLVARLFNKTNEKKHVMIVGCSSCLKNEVK